MTSRKRNGDRVVRRLGPRDTEDVVDVLCESFRDYPVMRYVFGGAGKNYERQARAMVRFFVACRLGREEFVIGVRGGTGLAAAALVSIPDGRDTPAALAPQRDALWRELGEAAEARYDAFGRACATFGVDAPHLRLNMIGVSPVEQGRGLGRVVLDYVHELSRTRADSTGVTLTTEEPANVPLYEHAGYERIGHARVSSTLETWGFFRPDDGPRNR